MDKIDFKDLPTYDDCINLNINEIHDLYKNFVNPGQVEFLASFGPGRNVVDKAQGVRIWEKSGKIILDFTGGIGVLSHGHNHPDILAVRKRFQSDSRMEVHKNYFSPYLASLSKAISMLMPKNIDISYFCNSGAEAVEGSIKLAFKSFEGRRSRILAADISFHGKLLGSAGLTGSPEVEFKWPTIPNIDRFEYNNINSIKKLITENRSASNESAYYALIIETMNASSLRECSPAFLEELRNICTKEKIVLIFDEVYTGWSKTGELFHFMHSGVDPDIVTYSKSFGAGKASIAGYTTNREIFNRAYGKLNDSIIHSTTYNGFGEETITALEGIRINIRDNYCDRAKKIEQFLMPKLIALKNKYPDLIRDVRGKGGLLGIILNDSLPPLIKASLKALPSDVFKDKRFFAKLITGSLISDLYNDFGILTYFGSNHEIPLIIAPSLIIEQEDLNYFLESLDKSLSKGKFNLITNFIKYKFMKK